MGQDQLKVGSGDRKAESPSLRLVAEEGASLSCGSLSLYAIAHPPITPGLRPPTNDHIPPLVQEGLGEASHTIVGCVDLYAYDPLNRRCAVGVMVASEHRRQGHALAMLRELDRIAHEVYHLHQLYADIAATNAASLELFRKAGFQECGHFRQWLALKDGTYADSIRMQKVLP